MHGWNDPIDPSDPNRDGRPAADHPAPEPWYDAVHHSYDPGGRYPYRSTAEHRHAAPDDGDGAATETYRAVSGYGAGGGRHREALPTDGYPVDGYPGEGYADDGYHAGWTGYAAGRHAEDAGGEGHRDDPYQRRVDDRDADGFWSDQHDRYRSPAATDRTAAGSAGDAEPADRRLPRPLVLAGAAAAATLAVMVGVGAVVLPSNSPEQSGTVTTADGGAVPTDETDLAGGATPSPSGAAPTSAAPSPSPSASPRRTATATATPRRTSAPPVRRTESAPASRSGGSTGGASTSGAVSSQEQEVINLVNKERAAAGCGAVAAESHLMTSARLHSEDQAEQNEMSHTGSDGSTFDERIKRAGYDGRTMAENVAYGYPTPAAVMDGWMNSSDHRANILNCAFKDIGVGVAKGSDGRLYWTQNFGG